MSPIPSITIAFAFSSVTPSVSLESASVEQSASASSQHLLGTSGLVFAVVAIVSVASYFYHGPRKGNDVRTTEAWSPWSSFISSIRHRGVTTTAVSFPGDIELGAEHVSMVYARFFHPTSWNVVECHPGTISAPAICVEDEGMEMPVSASIPPGVRSFLDMNDFDGAAITRASHIAQPNQRPPYDTTLATSVAFRSKVIGTTLRPDTFLRIPGQYEDDSSDAELEVPEQKFTGSPYDGICESSDTESDYSCSPYDGFIEISSCGLESDSEYSPCNQIAVTPTRSFDDLARTSGGNLDSSPYDNIMSSPLRSRSPSLRRCGMVDIQAHYGLKATIPDAGHNLGYTGFHCTGLSNLSELAEPASSSLLYLQEHIYGKQIGPDYDSDVAIRDRSNDSQTSLIGVDASAASREGFDLMRELLEKLRDHNMDCSPRGLSEDSDSGYSADDEDRSIPPLTPVSTLSSFRTDDNVYDEGLSYPLTPPPVTAINTSVVYKDRKPSPMIVRLIEKLQIVSRTSSPSPPSFPTKAYVRRYRDSRPLSRGRVWLPYLT